MAICINNLIKKYKNSIVLEHLDLTIKEGSIFGLLGPNGAGKTTLVSILNFLVPKDFGEIKILGYDLNKHEKEIKACSSLVPQSYAFYPTLSAYENLEFFGALYGLTGKVLHTKIDYCLEMTSLEKYRDAKAETFSGGLKRRLNIAIGLLNSPKILYLDEPTVGIDPQSRNYILQVIKNINQANKTTIVYTSHYMEEIEYLCDDIAILDQGKIVFHETKEKINAQSNIAKIHLSDTSTQEVNLQSNYDVLVDTFCDIKQKSLHVKEIELPKNNLENIFLSITKKELRD
ncbi:ABC transporter ATP-binding protein [Sulfurospirillum arsenophilum]|uniref:ABC transporter ATP-binding protein n=1 Tax=Sulfurospirillum arsenophilum TaxID=56698 RepID=UPI0005AAEEDB|nr:ABC transporter ATP-binding protein [Sulfurospirillum arsenophilum]